MLVIRCMSESITANSLILKSIMSKFLKTMVLNPIMHNKSYRFIIRNQIQ
jgi:hypothetical protein